MYSIEQIINSSALDKIDIKAILKYVLGLNNAQLMTNADKAVGFADYNKIQQLIWQRELGIPIAYLVQHKEFYSREFLVNRHTLIPRPETELLVEQVLRLAQQISSQNNSCTEDITIQPQNLWMLELGTGSGCIAITCKLENPQLQVIATDVAVETLAVAKDNAKRHNAMVDFKQGDWYAALGLNGINPLCKKFNIIVSNPPYIAKNDEHLDKLKYEPLIALTDNADGLNALAKIIGGAAEYLVDGGYLLVEHGYNQKIAVCELFKQFGFIDINTLQDYAGLDRISFAKIASFKVLKVI